MEQTMRATLMSRDVEIARIEGRQLYPLREELMPLYLRQTGNLEEWLAHRAIDRHRTHSRLLKKVLRLSEKDDASTALAMQAATITDTYWAEVSYEQILAWNPQYIVLASDASYTVEDVLADPNLEGCAAVENGNVIQIPGDAEAWDSPVPGGILGAVWLSSELHPEECPQADSEAVIHEFYETFYGFSYGEN